MPTGRVTVPEFVASEPLVVAPLGGEVLGVVVLGDATSYVVVVVGVVA